MRSRALFTLAACVLLACGDGTSKATRGDCPPVPERFVVQATGPHVSVIASSSGWRVGGGEPGDRRTASGNLDSDELVEGIYCALWRRKLDSSAGVARCAELSHEESRLAVRGIDELRDFRPFALCDTHLNELADELLFTLGSRLPPGALPPIDVYRDVIPDDCRAPPDFRMHASDNANREFEIQGGRFRSRLFAGNVKSDALNALACEVARYDWDALSKNEEDRAVLCREGATRHHADGWSYDGIAVEYQSNGVERSIRVGSCPPPLDLYLVIDRFMDDPRPLLEVEVER